MLVDFFVREEEERFICVYRVWLLDETLYIFIKMEGGSWGNVEKFFWF